MVLLRLLLSLLSSSFSIRLSIPLHYMCHHFRWLPFLFSGITVKWIPSHLVSSGIPPDHALWYPPRTSQECFSLLKSLQPFSRANMLLNVQNDYIFKTTLVGMPWTQSNTPLHVVCTLCWAHKNLLLLPTAMNYNCLFLLLCIVPHDWNFL